jgi:rhodanese-related sulfurtransferase
VARRLREEGFGEAYGLRGGLAAWLAAGGPVEPRD